MRPLGYQDFDLRINCGLGFNKDRIRRGRVMTLFLTYPGPPKGYSRFFLKSCLLLLASGPQGCFLPLESAPVLPEGERSRSRLWAVGLLGIPGVCFLGGFILCGNLCYLSTKDLPLRDFCLFVSIKQMGLSATVTWVFRFHCCVSGAGVRKSVPFQL